MASPGIEMVRETGNTGLLASLMVKVTPVTGLMSRWVTVISMVFWTW